jgi:integrase/recombinase XerD
MKTNQEYINEYLNRLQAGKKSLGTIKQYKSQLGQFSNFVNKSLIDVYCEDIENFISDDAQEIKTKRFKQSVICNFYNWMCDRNYVNKHPMMCRMTFGSEDKLLEFLEQEQVNIINEYFRTAVKKIKTQKRKSTKERDYVLFQFMISTGVRSGEVLGIKKSDLDLITNEVKIIRKRKKERIINFKYNLSKILKTYLEKYPNQSEYLFPSESGEKMSKSSLDNIFKKITKKTGIFIHPHMTRSTFAMLAIDNGMKPEDLQKHLDHSNPATTQEYYEIRNKRVKEAINQFAPDVAL